MSDLVNAIEHLANYPSPVLIFGETGSGKEAVAEILHALGPRPDRALIKFNCGSLSVESTPDQLFDSGMPCFGGGGAIDPGCFQLADGGSLLLNEVGELPLKLQGKLIRAVENLEIQTGAVRLDVRVMAATNRNLAAMVKAGSFRPDLYYRLAAASLAVPPLRNRQADLEGLIADLVASYNRQFGKQVDRISAHALALLNDYQWPGNLREMAHWIERAMLFCEDGRIGAGDLPAAISGYSPDGIQIRLADQSASITGDVAGISASWLRRGHHTGHQLDDALKKAIERSLVAAGGDCSRAAAMAGVSRVTFHHKMVRYGLTARGRGPSSADEYEATTQTPSH
jgi:DNA-binding NtrC family response regulator